ncbi:V-type ATP synthase subunit I [Colidextribacter sp. OB.20]|uniref:V-type ATP synthase subunit I n=1 Tax=Colidextribacter sp. OB.20 TaxID=2304568 RepID=UPI001FAE4AD9|nr:V-type ATP synthase subunit I [Colidextribacter sp. OB.20]
MAIVKMKRLRMVAMVQDREALLRQLQHMGCVEITQPEDDPDDPLWAQLTRPESEGLTAAHGEQSEAERALEVLKRYAPAKSGLLEPRPGLREGELLDEAGAQKARDMAREINDLDRRLAAIRAEENKLEAQKEVLRPWMALDLPLETGSTAQVTVQLGTLPAAVPMNQAEGEVQAAGELAQLTEVYTERDFHYCMLVCHTSQADAVLEALKALGWSRANLRDWTGTASENLGRLYQETKALREEAAAIQEKLSGMGGYNAPLRQMSDLAGVNVSREEARGRLVDTGQTFLLEGWVPEESWPALKQELDKFPCACEVSDPAPEDYPQVPVRLKNNWFTKPLNMVTDMYSLPVYGSLDPNPLMAPFFILFYGMMMADMGYGIIMVLVSLIVIKKARPDGATMQYMMPLLGLCGVSTFLWGAATGGFFGDLIPQMLAMLNHGAVEDYALPKLFDPLSKAVNVLVGALVLGVAQIFTGMAVSMYKQIKRGETMAALCNEGAWFLVFILAGVAALTGQTTPCVIAILVLLALTQGYGKKGVVGKLMGVAGSLYNNATGYFGDILSYSRLMALMLAGAVTAQVFNTLGAMTGNIFFFFVIAMVGNGLNFALNILGCFVHDMRLQCLEYFGRFYEDGGKPFRPLDINTKYYKVVK